MHRTAMHCCAPACYELTFFKVLAAVADGWKKFPLANLAASHQFKHKGRLFQRSETPVVVPIAADVENCG